MDFTFYTCLLLPSLPESGIFVVNVSSLPAVRMGGWWDDLAPVLCVSGTNHDVGYWAAAATGTLLTVNRSRLQQLPQRVFCC
jgi:hypothetical protein